MNLGMTVKDVCLKDNRSNAKSEIKIMNLDVKERDNFSDSRFFSRRDALSELKLGGINSFSRR